MELAQRIHWYLRDNRAYFSVGPHLIVDPIMIFSTPFIGGAVLGDIIGGLIVGGSLALAMVEFGLHVAFETEEDDRVGLSLVVAARDLEDSPPTPQ